VTTEVRAPSPQPTTQTAPAPSQDERRRLSRPRIALLLFVVALAASIGLAARDGLRVARDVRAARAAFHQLLDTGLSSDGDMRSQAAKGASLFHAANLRAHRSRWIGIWSHVPVFGQPARWLRGATDATDMLAREASDVVSEVEPRLSSARDPAGRIALLDAIGAEFSRLRAAAGAVEIPRPGWLLPPVNSADRELRNELARLRTALEDGAVASRGLRSFLAGPTSYVVLAANNAEMRAGGMILQAGVLHASGGSVATDPFHSTGDIPPSSEVAAPGEIERLYGWLDPGREWRNTGSSPNFPVVAPMYVSMASRTPLGKVDGALQLDVPGLRALLEVVGSVKVRGRVYNATNVERLVMHDLYVEFGPEQFARRHEFSRLGRATFRALGARHWDPRAFISALAKAAEGRHLMLWSSRPAEQEAWRRLGVDGSLARDGMMITIQNHAGNKLDWFLRSSVEITKEKKDLDFTRVTLHVRLDEPAAPAKEPAYIVGDGSIVPAGGYRALVAAYLPGWATNVKIDGAPTLLYGPDGPMRVSGTRVDVPAGGSTSFDISFDAPAGAHLVLLPSGRFFPTTIRVDGRTYAEDSGVSIGF
jgi:uncharacterized protein DUF4012